MIIFRTRALARFYRELATIVTAGVPIIDAVNILGEHLRDSRMRGVVEQIKQKISSGTALGEAMAEFPGVFPVWHINIIKYSEIAGRLTDGTARLAEYLEKEQVVQQRMIGNLVYPLFLLHVAIFLLPVTQFVTSGISGYVNGVIGAILPFYGAAALVLLLRKIFSQGRMREIADQFIINLPVFGGLARKFAVARFVRALQCLAASGVMITNAWKMASDACDNTAMKSNLMRSLPLLEQGQNISSAFKESHMFSPSIVGMMSSAEKSGSIAQMLNTIAVYSDQENETAMAVMGKLIPAAIYLVIAGYVGFRVVTFYTGHFNSIFAPIDAGL